MKAVLLLVVVALAGVSVNAQNQQRQQNLQPNFNQGQQRQTQTTQQIPNLGPKPTAANKPPKPSVADQREPCVGKSGAKGVCLQKQNCHIGKDGVVGWELPSNGPKGCPAKQNCCVGPAPATQQSQTPTAPTVTPPTTQSQTTAPTASTAPAPVKPKSACEKIALCQICTRVLTPGAKCAYHKPTGKCVDEPLAKKLIGLKASERQNYALQFWAGYRDAKEYPLEYECKNPPI